MVFHLILYTNIGQAHKNIIYSISFKNIFTLLIENVRRKEKKTSNMISLIFLTRRTL